MSSQTIQIRCEGGGCFLSERVGIEGGRPDPADVAAAGWSEDPMSSGYLCPDCTDTLREWEEEQQRITNPNAYYGVPSR